MMPSRLDDRRILDVPRSVTHDVSCGSCMIEVSQLAKVFPGPPEVVALRNATFTVGRGELVAITGSSGSGKSTLLNLLGCLDTPTSGRYMLNGLDIASLSEAQRCVSRAAYFGFVFQSFHLLHRRSVVDNVELAFLYRPQEAAAISSKERHRRIAETLEQVGLSHRADFYPDTLSGGERQRVAIARALVNQPSVLLCDEPTGNLDTANSEAVLRLLRDLAPHGISIVVVTHDANVAASCDRTLVMSNGVLVE
jgi:putative ABC transport system ATP-binding protein